MKWEDRIIFTLLYKDESFPTFFCNCDESSKELSLMRKMAGHIPEDLSSNTAALGKSKSLL